MLHQFLAEHRDEILERSRARVANRPVPRPTEAELAEGLGIFFDQLVGVLRREARGLPPEDAQMGVSATAHGKDRLRLGFTLAQLVHDYGDICQAITEMVEETDATIGAREFRVLNRCLDDAIARAVTEFEQQHEHDLAGLEAERLGATAHELRNALATAVMAFESLARGNVAIGGATGGVLRRSLARLRDIVDRSLAEVRIQAGVRLHTRFRLASLVEEVAIAGELEAEARGLGFAVDFDPELELEADQHLLASAVGNLLQNAFKYTRAGGSVSLTARPRDGHVLIDVADQCGGLPAGRSEQLFRPVSPGGGDASGLGIGLSIARRAAEANGGTLRVKNLPGTGCVFSVCLPLAPSLH